MEDRKVCLKCFAYIPGDALYCPSCGVNLFPEKEKKGAKVEGEKKFITCLFVLIEKPQYERFDKNKFKERIEVLYEVDKISREFGGWIDKWLGLNGLMIIFGIPRAKSMDAEIACKLALEIEKYLKEKRLNYKIGINSGWVYLGQVGPDKYLHKTVIGDTINIAYRLAEISNSEIIISEDTNLLIEERFHTIKKKKMFLKGKEDIISIYELKDLREKPKEMHFRIPFIGREEELRTLNLYKELAKKRKGNVLFIKGPGGIGKTTLKNYWLKIFEEKQDFFIFEGEPLFETYGSPGGVIQKAIIKFIEKEKNIQNIKEYEEIKEILFNGEIKREFEPFSYIEILKLKLRKFLESLLEIKPIIFIVDSCEKIDEITKIILEYLLITLNHKIFFLLLGRENPFERELIFIKERELLPFNYKEINEILRRFLKEDLSTDFVRKFMEITESIPLYVTEFLKIIARKKSKSFEIPGNLISAILEFYDILTKEEKEVLEKMSILIEWNEKGELKDFFNEEEKNIIKNFVEEEIFEKEGNAYKFINPLIRNVIYNAVLKKKKLKIHSDIVNILDSKIDVNKLSSYLFYHSFNGELWEKAFEFALLSGKDRFTQGAFKESIEYLNKAEECFQKMKEKNFVKLSEVFEYKAEAKKNLGLIEEAIKDFHKSIVMAEGADEVKLFSLKQKLAESYLEKNEIEPCKKIITEILNVKDKIKDEIIFSTHLTLGKLYFNLGKYHLSLAEYNKAYNIMKKLNEKRIYKIALTLSELHKEVGNFEMAEEYINIAEENVKEYKDILYEFKIMENKFDLYIKTGNFIKIKEEVNKIIGMAKFIENNYYY
ncbi:MAG: adenylate/guanylate cyclase domain-containing protein, partial [candidate division WOR-3 bacterium]